MTHEEFRVHQNKVKKLWRLNNPEKNRLERKRYKNSEKGRVANQIYRKKYDRKPERRAKNRVRNRIRAIKFKENMSPEQKEQRRKYFNSYFKEYIKDAEHHRKFLIRQRDYRQLRKALLQQQNFCSECCSEENLQLHHKTYDETKNITILCRTCHGRLHRK